MKSSVIAVTVEKEGLSPEELDACKVFSGKNAGICYLKDIFSSPVIQDRNRSMKRFVSTSNMNHHSIADHVRVEVLFEDISKMLAIVLNSLQDYATSEKSGRYTVMSGNSEEENRLYSKWKKIFKARIIEEYPHIDDEFLKKNFDSKYPNSGYIIQGGRKLEMNNRLPAEIDKEANDYWFELLENPSLPSVKLAQENARYVLSVFTRSTTMGYSTSLRQWNYIYDWCHKYMAQFIMSENGHLIRKDTDFEASYFEEELYNDFNNLQEFIYNNLYVDELRDSKNRCFEFLTTLTDVNHPMKYYQIIEPDYVTGRVEGESEDDNLDVSYSVSYPASFVHIAQAERHRTLKYFMMFNPTCMLDYMYFVPPILEGTEYEDMWLSDLRSVGYLVPQATMIGIIETGHISDFILKCKERLCGRAQWEIMNQTKLTSERFLNKLDSGNLSKVLQAYVEQLRGEPLNKVTTKCTLCGSCAEPCQWGKKNALNRSI